MTVGYYECHITMLGDSENIKRLTESVEWHYSKIDGDPILGKGIKHYATINFKKENITLQNCIENMNEVKKYMIRSGISVIRTKIEEIVYDERL